MPAEFRRLDPRADFHAREGCYINELSNVCGDPLSLSLNPIQRRMHAFPHLPIRTTRLELRPLQEADVCAWESRWLRAENRLEHARSGASTRSDGAPKSDTS